MILQQEGYKMRQVRATGFRAIVAGVFAIIMQMAVVPASLVLFQPTQLAAQPLPVKIDKLVFDLGIYSITVPKMEMSGTTLTKAEIQEIFSLKSQKPLLQRLEKFSFSEATIPDLIIATRLAGQVTSTTYKNVKLFNVVAGRIGRYTADSASLTASTDTDNGGMKLKAEYLGMSVEGFDIAAITRVLSETTGDENARMQTLSESMSVDSVRYEMKSPDADMTMSSGKLKSGSFKARPGKISLLDFFDTIKNKDKGDFEDMDDEEKAKFFSSLVQIVSNFEFGGSEIENLVMHFSVADAAADKKPGKLAAGKPQNAKRQTIDMRIANIKFATQDVNFHLEGLEMSIPDEDINLKIASYDLKGYSLKPTLDAARAFIATGKFDQEDLESIDPRDFMPTLGTSRLAGLSMQAPDKKGDFGGPVKLSIAEIKSSLSNQIRGVPTALSYRLDHATIEIPANSTNEGVRFMRENGLEKLDFSAVIEAAWNESNKELAISEISFSGEKMGAVKFSGKIGNMPKEIFSSGLSTSQILALALTAKSAEITIENKGIMGLTLKTQAKEKGKTEDEIKQQMITDTKAELVKEFGEGDKVNAVVAGLTTLLSNGKSLTISVKPKSTPDRSLDGLGAMDIFLSKNPKEFLEKVDVEVKAE